MVKNEKLIRTNIGKHFDSIQHMVDHNGKVLELRKHLYTRIVQMANLPESEYVRNRVIKTQEEINKLKEYPTKEFIRILDLINKGNKKLEG